MGSTNKVVARMVVESNVYLQIVRDLCIRIYNIDFVKSKCRTDYVSICECFDRIEKRARRGLNFDLSKMERRSQIIADLADEAEDIVTRCSKVVRSKMLNIVRYDKLEFATLLGMTAGFLDCINQISETIKKKKSSDARQIMMYLKHTEREVGIERMNETDPDFSEINDNFVEMFKQIGLLCQQYVDNNY